MEHEKLNTKETANSDLGAVSGWLEFNSNKSLFNTEAKKNCLCLFDDGSIIRFNEEHPMAILTHFKLACH